MIGKVLGNQQATLRFAMIGILVLVMLIPLAMVEGVTEERQRYFDMTFFNIAESWGASQDVSGPFLIVPEIERSQVINDAGEVIWRERYREHVVLPEDLHLDVQIDHQYRRRAIYEVPVYLASLTFRGFLPALAEKLPPRPHTELRLDEARLVVGVTHTQAISQASEVKLGGSVSAFTAGTGQAWIGSGIGAGASALAVDAPIPFEFTLDIRGTHQLGFVPTGGVTNVTMHSTWPHPSFSGRYLPEAYTVSESGFQADWVVHELARDLPATWRLDSKKVELADSFAWVALFQPVTDYSVVERAIKYGVLFVALTFLGFVCFEFSSGVRFHPAQYGVVGIGLVLFYLALLSLSEHVSFVFAYLIATSLLTALISWYVWAMTRAWRMTAWMATIVLVLYATLYVLLQLEAFALLVGTAVLFVGLFGLMYTTRSLTVIDVEEGQVAVA